MVNRVDESTIVSSGRMQTVILAAGQGIRLRPYTKLVPKSLFTVKGVTLLTHQIDKLNEIGIENRDIFVVFSYLGEEIKGFLNRYHPDVKSIKQINKVGTAAGLESIKPYVKDKWVSVIYSDIYFEDSLDFLKLDEPIIVVKEVEDVSRFGKVCMTNGYLKDIKEKSEKGKGYIFAGIAKVPKEIFEILGEIKPNKDTGEYYLTDAILLQNKLTPFRVYKLKGKWLDVGKEESLIEARNG